MATAEDRRVGRTRQALEAALLSLIKEKEFDRISVQEIIDRANVARATFYSHYENKEDLLESGFEGLLAELRERQQRARIGGPADQQLFAFSHHLLAHAHEQRDIFPAMVSKRGGSLIQHLLRELLIKVVREDVKALRASQPASPVPNEAVVQFIAGGLFGMIMGWMSGRVKLSVEDMDNTFRRLAIGALKNAFAKS